MKQAYLFEAIDGERIKCLLCNHYCILEKNRFGICGVRKNDGGVLYSLSFGNIIAENIDPVEKKPLYHFLPGSRTYSIAAPGCNFHCRFCQNWHISQIQEKRVKTPEHTHFNPTDLLQNSMISSCKSIAFTYTEPTTFYEIIKDTAEARSAEDTMRFVMISNGFMSAECLEQTNRYIDAYNIDLKSFSDQFYRQNCGGRLQPVLDNISSIYLNNNWLEVTTMIIPGENDSPEEINDIAQFIAEISKDIPWHISRFFPNYRFTEHRITDGHLLELARDIGKKHGLKYIYLGNVPSENSTICPGCNKILITRAGFDVIENELTEDGNCPQCGKAIAGIWT
ncbi:MAG: AmmeMemoRadiSam system radical SAM enzyme [Chitinispirillaceae bacterium]|nr:AmmeMemoRadiSam system radical SAM enzyme [Chitinispirillaceae bacterium]